MNQYKLMLTRKDWKVFEKSILKRHRQASYLKFFFSWYDMRRWWWWWRGTTSTSTLTPFSFYILFHFRLKTFLPIKSLKYFLQLAKKFSSTDLGKNECLDYIWRNTRKRCLQVITFHTKASNFVWFSHTRVHASVSASSSSSYVSNFTF